MTANMSPDALWFLHLIAGGSLLLTAAAGAGCLARRSPAWRHWLLTLAFAGNLALLPLSLVLPLYELEVLPAPPSPRVPPEGDNWGVSPEGDNGGGSSSQEAVTPVTSAVRLSETAAPPTAAAPAKLLPRFGWLSFGWMGYSLGLLWVVGGIVVEIVHLRRLADRAEPHGRVPLGDARTADVFLSGEIDVPLGWGWRRPIVLLPAAAREWSEDELRWVLVHEATHLRRRDPLINALAQLVCALQWFNPLAWWSARRLRLESERATDDMVVAEGADPARYAELLLRFAGELVSRRRALAAAMADRSGLGARLSWILERRRSCHRPSKHRPGRFAAGATALAVLVLVAGLATLRLAATPGEEPRTTYRSEPTLEPRAAWLFGDRESRSGVAPLVEALHDRDPEARAMAAWALGEIKDPVAIEPLTDALDDDDFYVREMVILALGEHEHPSAIPALVEQLSGPHPDLRSAAVQALAEIDHRDAFESLLGALDDVDASVRVRAAEVLGERRDRDAVPALLERLADPSPAVRESIAVALGRLRSRDAVEALADAIADAEPAVRRAAARALGEIGDARAVDRLIRVLRDRDPAVRAAAVWALDEVHEG